MFRPPFAKNVLPALMVASTSTLLPIDEVLLGSPRFIMAAQCIEDTLALSWEQAAQYVKRFESERPVFDFLQQWDADTHAQRLASTCLLSVPKQCRSEIKQVDLPLPPDWVSVCMWHIFFAMKLHLTGRIVVDCNCHLECGAASHHNL